MTLHSAKGLEFAVAVVAGLEEGVLAALQRKRQQGWHRGGAPPALRRDDASRASALPHDLPASADRRALSGSNRIAVPRRRSPVSSSACRRVRSSSLRHRVLAGPTPSSTSRDRRRRTSLPEPGDSSLARGRRVRHASLRRGRRPRDRGLGRSDEDHRLLRRYGEAEAPRQVRQLGSGVVVRAPFRFVAIEIGRSSDSARHGAKFTFSSPMNPNELGRRYTYCPQESSSQQVIEVRAGRAHRSASHCSELRLRGTVDLDINLAIWIVRLFGVYFALGLIFALAFVFRGVQRIDAAAKGASVGFRLLILPGCAALWPLLTWRWIRGSEPPTESNAHRRAA